MLKSFYISFILLLILTFCTPQLPYTKRFPYKKDIKEYIIDYNSIYKGKSNTVDILVDSAGNFYINKSTYLSSILIVPPNGFSIVNNTLVLLYDVRRKFLDTTNFNKHLLQKYRHYFLNDLHCDYKIAQKDSWLEDSKINKGDTLWGFGNYSYMISYPYWKITKQKKGYTKEVMEYNQDISNIYKKTLVKKIQIYRYYVPKNHLPDD